MLSMVQGVSVWSRDAMFILQFYMLDPRVLLSMCLTLNFKLFLKSTDDMGFKVSHTAAQKEF